MSDGTNGATVAEEKPAVEAPVEVEREYRLPESLGQAVVDYLMSATPPRDQAGGILVGLVARMQSLEEVGSGGDNG